MARVPVETVLTARDVNTARMFQQLSSAAQHYDSLVRMGTQAFSTFQSLALGGGVLAIGGGLAATAQSLLKVNQELESTTQNLAGSIQVYKYATSYADALLLADDALLKIKKDAASLPGTDTDFIRAFSITFPEQAQLGVKTLDEAIKRSNQLTSVLLAKGVDSGQIGRDIGQMLRGHAGADVRSFMELKGQMGVKDAEEFNKKSAKERLKLLDSVIAKNKDVINAFGTTWDAVSSTAQSSLKSLVLAGSKPLFEEAKKNLKAMNDYLEPMMPKMEMALRMGGTAIVAGTKALGGSIAGSLQALAPRQYAVAQTAEALAPIFNSLATAGQSVLTFLTPVADGLSAVASALWGGVIAALPGLLSVAEAVVSVGAALMGTVGEFAAYLGDSLGPVLVGLGGIVGWAGGVIADVLIVAVAGVKPVLDATVGVFKKLIEVVVSAAGWIGNKFGGGDMANAVQSLTIDLGKIAKNARAELGIDKVNAAGAGELYLKRMREAMEKAEMERQRATIEAAKKGKGGKPAVNQDFRGSKFSIEQKFAQGFDPGRVLTAVREDAAKLAQRRLTAGTTPLFGMGV